MSDEDKEDLVEELIESSVCKTFVEHRDKTVADLIAVAELMQKLIENVKQGDMDAFEEFWIEGGTEEGDAKILSIRERLALRYYVRKESVAEHR